MPLFHAEQHALLIQSLQQGNTLRIHLSQLFMVFSFTESITLVSPLAVTIADDNSDKDNSPVVQGSLSFTAKYLYNEMKYYQ